MYPITPTTKHVTWVGFYVSHYPLVIEPGWPPMAHINPLLQLQSSHRSGWSITTVSSNTFNFPLAPAPSHPTIAHTTSAKTVKRSTAALWQGLKDDGIHVETLVLSAASLGRSKPLLEAGRDEFWEDFETNTCATIDFNMRFYGQEAQEIQARKYTN
ncbi:hypothetical protein FOBRF1_010997 [Fusarium oxysporum]